ncbi:MAG: hypothetical protein IKI04_01295, partial [Bacilli bacterium]|nr:hypothetical protein [Bacilli bacterium]
MSTKKQSIIIIAIVLLVGLIITGSSYAFWMWSSNTSKNVIFNTSSDLKKYIVYDEGNSKFTGNFEATNSYNQGMHSTISIYKKAEAANTDLFATIHMNINEIGTNMRQSQALKWIVTSGTSANIGSVLASGNFVGVNNGDNLDLVTNLEVTTTETFYTIWIWLDASLNPSNLLTGETLDTNVWTEIMQLEGAENRYEITRVTANHQTINASVVDTQYKITNYAVTNSNVTPSVWTSIPSNDQNYIYNMPPYNVNEIGTYHVWFKDSANRTISKSVEVTGIDNTPATTEYTAIFYYQSDGTNGSTTVTSTTASCTASSGSSCNVNIPTAVKNSVGTYNNTYAGLANTTGTMSTSSGANSSAPTVTLSANTTYYAVYSTEVTIRIPDDTSTCSTDTYYRNQWFTSTSAMASTVLATSATGTNEPIFDSSINDGLETYNLYGYGTTANSTTKTYNDFAAIKNSNSTSVYGIMYTQRSVQFYYSNSSTGSKTNSTVSGNRYIVCTHDTTANYSNASVTAPGTTAPYGTSLIGWATSANSMTTATVNTANTTYYAIYRGNVTNYYYSGSAYTSRTLYRNGTYGSETNYTMYLSTANNDLSNYETATGPGSSEWAGLSTAADTTPEYSTVTEAATSSSASLYTVYRMYALFHTGENVSSIGANGDTCKVSATGASSGGTSCTIILPSIESNDGYISVGWSLTSGDITGTVTGNNYTLNSAVVNLYANATDPLPPTGTISTTVSSNTVTATVTVIDNGSGPAESYGWKISTDATCDGNTTGFVDSTSDNYSFNVTNPGIHYICVRIEDNAGNYGYLIKPAKTSHIDYVYTGNYQTFTAPADGYYYIKTRGAQGGNGANGGESSGYIYLNENDNLYVYVGEQGHANNTQTNTGGWNGGGASGSHADAKSYGGGGATDIRLVAGDWNNATSLNSRIMVAGGGGGGFAHNTTTYTITPGNGGGLIGLNGTGSMTGSDIIDPTGGSQTTGGAFGRTTGSGGVGAFGYAAQSNSSGYGGGGGGGYYGGGNGYGRGGAAGSSFISGYAGSNAITSASSTTPSENTKHYSGKYFVVGEMTAGTNTGNGSVRIEFVGDLPERKNTKLSNVRYVKDCVAGSTVSKYIQWVEMQVIKNGMNIASGITPSVSATQAPSDNDYNREYSNITDGRVDNNAWGEPAEYGLQCATIDLGSAQSVDEIAVWHLNKGGREFLNDVLLVSIDGTNWTPIAGHEGVETSIGLRVNAWTDKEVDLQELIQVEYPYSGEYRAFTVPVNGYYYAETNGAKGGSGANGGYASGVIHLNAGEKLYVYTGGTGGTSNSAVNAGGWNGGGTAGNTSTTYGYGGGGATDIRIVNGAWDNATSLESRIMVAGGGGGTYQVTGSHSGYGGAGGGLLGSVGGGSFSNSNTTTDATVS